MKKNHKCKNPNGCTCDNNHENEVTIVEMHPAIPTAINGDNNGYDPNRPYAIPVTCVECFGAHSNAQPICIPDKYWGNLDSHVEYMAGHLEDTTRLIRYMGRSFGAPDSYVCTKDNKLGYGVTNPASGRFMYGMEFGGSDDTLPVDTVITFTENNGLRHAAMNSNDEIIDLGPVTNPVVIGPRSHPQALVVPMANISAVTKAEDMLYNAIINHIEDQSANPCPRIEENKKLEKVADSKCIHTLPMVKHFEEDKLPF